MSRTKKQTNKGDGPCKKIINYRKRPNELLYSKNTTIIILNITGIVHCWVLII